MILLQDSLRAEEQLRANWIVSDLARLLGCPTTEEPPLESFGINLLGAEHEGWEIHAYLELEEEDLDRPLGDWVLILSRGETRSFRVLQGDDFRPAADHIRQFVREAAYRRRWLS
jgi:hypothetical protein